MIRTGQFTVRSIPGGRATEVTAATVVLVTPNAAFAPICDELRDDLTSIVRIGDALSPRDP